MFACFAVAAVSVFPAVSDIDRLGSLIVSQVGGTAQGTDFLNLYAGADLLLHAPRDVYDPVAQLAVQDRLTGSVGALAPFYLPPYAVLLIGWLALVPYGAAYLVWLAIGVGSLCLSAAWLAPRWGAGSYPVVWLLACLLYLPAFEGLAEGQTSALMLLAFAGVCRLLQRRPPSAWSLAVCGLIWMLKPQLAPWLVLALVVGSGRGALVRLAGMLAALSGVAWLLLTPAGFGAYRDLSHQKLLEVLSPDAQVLPGPTLLHAAGWLVGNGWPAQTIAIGLGGAAGLAFFVLWRHGVARDDAVLLQLAALPLISVVCAPYALVHELTVWLASFWLLWQYTHGRPVARALLLWITAAIWLAGDLGVLMPGSPGSDIAALSGASLVCLLAWMLQRHIPAPVRYT